MEMGWNPLGQGEGGIMAWIVDKQAEIFKALNVKTINYDARLGRYVIEYDRPHPWKKRKSPWNIKRLRRNCGN